MNLWRKLAPPVMEQCRLCPTKLEGNAAFALQNLRDIVSGNKKTQIFLKFFFLSTFSKSIKIIFVNQIFFYNIYTTIITTFCNKTILRDRTLKQQLMTQEKISS